MVTESVDMLTREGSLCPYNDYFNQLWGEAREGH